MQPLLPIPFLAPNLHPPSTVKHARLSIFAYFACCQVMSKSNRAQTFEAASSWAGSLHYTIETVAQISLDCVQEQLPKASAHWKSVHEALPHPSINTWQFSNGFVRRQSKGAIGQSDFPALCLRLQREEPGQLQNDHKSKQSTKV